ncbi:hypothetical protein B9T33_13575 [Acinetobacter sp. ANC 5054]|uniref:abortive infection family protein n=1 Tax=Acinetobacter sp. ANC 5054 TaxID=1977877 RepID=UPI000A33C5D1|nr:abortive infection family protein [Acinetobacter sp. ANC 5054]OTG78989.1 hypothetical protein B9T33_13575 [Acinetobacter sp. ANC 5054]
MTELNEAQKLELAKYLMNFLNAGDWQELAILTKLETSYNWQSLYKDVKWANDSLKKNCIDAVRVILGKDPANLQFIWNINGVQNSLKRKNLELYKFIESIINKQEFKTVESPNLANASKNVFEALVEAELLIGQMGATSAYDRTHTALHGFLQTVCDKNQIAYGQLDSITALLPKVNLLIKSKVVDDGRNDKVFEMLRSANAILEKINYLRNNHSMSHPTEELLNEDDAHFAINLTRSIMSYIDNIIEKI